MGAMEDASAANAAAMARMKLNSDGSYDWVGAQSSIPGAAPPTARTPNADALDASARASFTPPQAPTASAPAPAGNYGSYGGATGNYGYPAPAAAQATPAPAAAANPSETLQHAPAGSEPAQDPQNPIAAATGVPSNLIQGEANANGAAGYLGLRLPGGGGASVANNYVDNMGRSSWQPSSDPLYQTNPILTSVRNYAAQGNVGPAPGYPAVLPVRG